MIFRLYGRRRARIKMPYGFDSSRKPAENASAQKKDGTVSPVPFRMLKFLKEPHFFCASLAAGGAIN
jgi:hypothetical protein